MRPLWFPAVLMYSVMAFAADDPFGEQTFQKFCAACHDQGGDRVPPRTTLQQMSASAITRALTTGTMREVGAKLSSGELRGIANFLGKAEATGAVTDRVANRCTASPPLAGVSNGPTWGSWGAGLANWRFQDSGAAGLAAADVPKLKLKWAFGFLDAISMRSQPAVYGGRVFAGGVDAVYSLDAAAGCVHWASSISAPVRSGIAIANLGNRALVVFGDVGGNLRALDASTGQPVWQLRADDHPATMVTSTPAFHNGRLYFGVSSYEEAQSTSINYLCCTFRGSVQAVDAATGRLLWKTYAVAEAAKPGKATSRGAKTMGPSGAGVWTTPTLDPNRNVMYVTTGDNYSDPPTNTSDAVLALAMDSGKILWSKQLTEGDAYNSSCPLADKANCPDSDGPDFDFGSSAILVRLANGRRVLVLPQKSGMVHGVDPDQQGKILWQSRAGQGGTLGGIQWGAATDGTRVYAALSDIAWLSRTATGRTPDPNKGGGMFAFRVDNGERMWMTPAPGCGGRRPCSPAQSAAVSAIPGAVFSGSVDGHIRAYSTADGKIIWDYDTVRDYQTVNGIPGKGGALDAGGPVIAGGMVFVNSGYGQWSALPGNVLLAFGVE
jgi:polyvinyl alcohol dehydrogenase (cytochrome)